MGVEDVGAIAEERDEGPPARQIPGSTATEAEEANPESVEAKDGVKRANEELATASINDARDKLAAFEYEAAVEAANKVDTYAPGHPEAIAIRFETERAMVLSAKGLLVKEAWREGYELASRAWTLSGGSIGGA